MKRKKTRKNYRLKNRRTKGPLIRSRLISGPFS